MLRFIITFTLTLVYCTGFAQYFQYSQYNFALQRINPATVAASDYASASVLYRNQATAGNANLKSSLVSAMYPIMSRRSGMRWSGVGISLMDDHAGGIFTTQEASLSYAINVFLNKFQIMSLGFKTLYQQRKVDLNGLYTGSQYVPDRGFDNSIFSGENLQFLKTDFVTFSAGLYGQQNDRSGNKLAYWGISIFDFNKPQDSFSGVNSQLNSTVVATAGITVYQQNELSVTPEILYTRSSSNNVLNVGAITSYTLKPLPNQIAGRVDLITKYVAGRSGIVGVQFHKQNMSVGFSYDFPLFNKNPGNVGAFEVGLELKRPVDPRLRKNALARRNTPVKKSTPQAPPGKPVVKKNGNSQSTTTQKDTTSIIKTKQPEKTLKETIQAKQDSVIATADAGQIKHQPLAIEKVTLHFNFEFNSSELDEESKKYLDELSTVLTDNEHLKIKLTGHTDNVGSAKFNQRLSVYRAAMIREYLIGKGIHESRIEAEGKGLTEPLNENRTEEERAKNRRVELVILYDY